MCLHSLTSQHIKIKTCHGCHKSAKLGLGHVHPSKLQRLPPSERYEQRLSGTKSAAHLCVWKRGEDEEYPDRYLAKSHRSSYCRRVCTKTRQNIVRKNNMLAAYSPSQTHPQAKA
jgi:hypothetical protein